MLLTMSRPLQQATIRGFVKKMSDEEWARELEQIRQRRMEEAEAMAQAEPSVEIIPQPSIQHVPQKRRPGRPRKKRTLVVDLTSKSFASPERTNDHGTQSTGGTSKRPVNTTPPSVKKTRTDWMHPGVFLRIYKRVCV